MFEPPILTLALLRHNIDAKGLSPARIAAIVGDDKIMSAEVVEDLRSKDTRRQREPWLDEAWVLMRVLGCDHICSLIGQDMDAIDPMPGLVDDLTVWRSGCRLPLSYAVRLARRFGLSDPAYLYDLIRLRSRNAIFTSLWRMTPATGECAHCGGSGDHSPDCLPNNLWGPRDTPYMAGDGTIEMVVRPKAPGKRLIGHGQLAPGLKALRLKFSKRQSQMADILRCSVAHYSKMESQRAKLSEDNARILMHTFGIQLADLLA